TSRTRQVSQIHISFCILYIQLCVICILYVSGVDQNESTLRNVIRSESFIHLCNGSIDLSDGECITLIALVTFDTLLTSITLRGDHYPVCNVGIKCFAGSMRSRTSIGCTIYCNDIDILSVIYICSGRSPRALHSHGSTSSTSVTGVTLLSLK